MGKRDLTRKDVIKLGGASALAAMAPMAARAARPGLVERPNILFITVDQMRSLADVPATIPLPNFRRLVREGRSFTNYYVHMAPCGPSRSVIYTGQHAQKTGMYTNPPGEYATVDLAGPPPLELPVSMPTVGTMLREQGYYTAYKGKWHLSVIDQRVRAATKTGYPNTSKALEPYGFADYGFDGEHIGMTWAGFSHDGFIAADSIDLMGRFAKGATGGKPWFLAVNLVNPHDIMFYEGDDEGPNGSAGIGPVMKPPAYPPYDKNWNLPLPVSFYKDDLSTKPAAQRGQRGGFQAQAGAHEAAWRTYQNYYFNCMRDVDVHIGQLLAAVERLGFARNTVVILTGDHGERGGAHGMSGKGGDMYKETIRVPLIARGPGISAGRATAALGGAVDLAPTLLSLAGLSDAARASRYPDLHGVSLTSVFADPAARTERDRRGILFDYVTAQGPGAAGARQGREPRNLLRGVYDGRYKFARYFAQHEHHIPADWATLTAHNDLELYDVTRDPDELVNLAAQPEAQRDLILALNAKVNALIAAEVGADTGSIYPGGANGQYVLRV